MAGEELRVTEGNAHGARLTVDAELLIGRSATQEEGRLGDDPEISRRHARVARGPGGQLTIEDLGSANGTFVNDDRIDGPRELNLGDVVKVGQTLLHVTDVSGRVPERTRLGGEAPMTRVPSAAERLLVTLGADTGRLLPLGDEFVIGRAVSGDGRLGNDPELSRRHARVFRNAEGRLTIEDLGSANGTFVNGMRIEAPQVLSVGDSIRVGLTTMELTDSDGPPAAAAPEAGPPPAPPEPAPAPPEPAPAPPPPRLEPPPPPPEPAPPEPAPPAPAPAPRLEPPPPPAPPAPERQRPARPRAPARPPRRAKPARATPPDALPLGSTFAGCRVEEIIGHGDMGVVYRAEELALQRPVALKLILPEHSQDERFRERFRRESKVAASIDHPNVIPLLDAGDEAGVLYIMMRLVEGTDLRAVIAADGHVEPRRAARIVGQVGAALDAAHVRGLVHRDVKPANVLLARRDHVYLSDFGLAKRASEVGGLTRQGSIVARAEYVAPEQITEDRVDALTDVYTLGCLLFEALTGEPPYATEGGGGAMLAHVNEPPPSPLERRPGLPVQFDEVVQRAMAKDPSERYPSAGDLGRAALVAAGGLRRAPAESVVATGAAAPSFAGAGRPPTPDRPQPARSRPEPGPDAPEPERGRPREGSPALRWAVALGSLAILAAGMIAALGAIEKL